MPDPSQPSPTTPAAIAAAAERRTNAEEKLQSKQSADARARADLLERMQGKSSAEMQQLIDQRAKDLNVETHLVIAELAPPPHELQIRHL